MPELPDVEVYKRYVDSTALHQPIADVAVLDDRLLEGMSGAALRRALRGAAFEATRRHGKHLFVRLCTDRWLALHFGMSGALQYYKGDDAPEYAYLRVAFENGYHLALVMPRKLGRVRLVDDPDAFIAAQALGPDARDLAFGAFRNRLADRRGMIKSALMDQGVIAGLGNIYSDEILYQAGIHPRTAVQALDDDALRALHAAMQRVLDAAIDAQADPEALPADRFMLPHRYGDQTDPRTGTPLDTVSVAGRTSYYSPARQPAP